MKRTTPSTYPAYESDKENYIDYLVKCANQFGKVPLFIGYTETPGKVCFYDREGEKKETSVSNLGALMQEIWPELDSFDVEYYAAPASPVTVNGSIIDLSDDSSKNTIPQYIVISLKTNIWFPYLHLHPLIERKLSLDNVELAKCHTPRLNTFLTNVKKAILDIGGTWEPAFPSNDFYSPFRSETGIILPEMER